MTQIKPQSTIMENERGEYAYHYYAKVTKDGTVYDMDGVAYCHKPIADGESYTELKEFLTTPSEGQPILTGGNITICSLTLLPE
jgi:hypothetical protein